MQRHLIAFDLDETLSDSHIYKEMTSQLYVYKQDMLSLEEDKKRWSKKKQNPAAYVKQKIKAKMDRIENNRKRIAQNEREIESQKKGACYDDFDTKNETVNYEVPGLSSSGEGCSLGVLLEPDAVITNCENTIAECKRENENLQDEIDRINDDLDAAALVVVEEAELMLSQLGERAKKVAAMYDDLMTNIDSQWEVISRINVMCDKLLLQDLVAVLQHDGHVVAIATFNNFAPLVSKFVEEKCGLDLKRLLIDCTSPSAPNEYKKFGKNNHLKRLIDLCDDALCAELKENNARVLLIDDDQNNIDCAIQKGFVGYHFNVKALLIMSKGVANNACNAYLAFLIVKFGYEEKLSDHIARLKLGPMIDYIKAGLQRQDVKQSASLDASARTALRKSGMHSNLGGNQLAAKEERKELISSRELNK